MSDFDLIVRADTDLAITKGKFAAIGQNLRGSADTEIGAHGLQIMPGVIDAHVHFNEPGRTDWEGFETGSRAAAAGGTTTVFDMPLNSSPPTINAEAFDQKRTAAENNSLVDFALWGGLVPGNIDDLPALRDRGAIGLKAFMSNSGIDDFPCVDDRALRAGMKRAAELGLIVAVHAESEEITSALTSEKLDAGKVTVRDYLESRPISAELDAIRRAISFAAETRCRLHIVHVSSADGVELVAQARAKDVDVSCETCPHYLVLSEKDMERLGAVAKCAPPLRSKMESDRLRAGLTNVSTIGSDHSPSPWPMKDRENFFQAWGGISGCQHLLPLLLDAGISFETISRLTSANVAARFGLSEKGEIAIGKDADFTVVDLAAEGSVTAESLHYRHKHSPYVGQRLRGRIVHTYLRGQPLVVDGKLVGLRPGKFLRPQKS